MARKKQSSRAPTIIERSQGINPGSRKAKLQYSLGKSNFLDSQQRSTIKGFQTNAHKNNIYNAVVLRVEQGDVPNI